jgi:predicted unusual protein kinase regulating ubiquinone biosynthesis (AarF/ABC1/UbiB family)
MFFGFFLQFWWLGKIKKFLSKERKDNKYRKVYSSQARKFTGTAVELGGLIIKLGQFVSSRVDILPKEYTDILSELQDSVAPVEAKIAVKRIEEELSNPISVLFESFNYTPVAAASLGQVHKAVLKNGESVAVKVMRPGIEDIVTLDLSTFKVLIRLARRFTKVSKFVDLEDVYNEFKEVITEELDYKKEAANLETFQDHFKDFPGVMVPNVFWEFTTGKVLVMEFIEGVKINEIDKLEGTRVNKKKLASILYLSYLKQLMEDGFFHADPHPGNLLVKKDGTLAYIDFGMVGNVSNEMKDNMVKLSLAIYLKDPGGIVEALDDLGFIRKNTEKAALTKNIKTILSGFSKDGYNIRIIQNEDFLEELREFLYQQPFQIPSRTTFLGKAIITVFSICNGLDENFDLIALTKPYVEDIMSSKNANPTKEKVLDQVKNTFLNVIPTFRKAVHLIDQFESGEIRLSPPKSFEKRLEDAQTFQTRKIVLAIFGTGLLIAGSQMVDHNNIAGTLLMAFGGLITLSQAIRSGSRGRRTRRRHPFV